MNIKKLHMYLCIILNMYKFGHKLQFGAIHHGIMVKNNEKIKHII